MGPFFFSSAVDRIESKNGSTLYREIKKRKEKKRNKTFDAVSRSSFCRLVRLFCSFRFCFLFDFRRPLVGACLCRLSPIGRSFTDDVAQPVPQRRYRVFSTEFQRPVGRFLLFFFCLFANRQRRNQKKKKNRPTVRSSRREQRRTWQINKKKRKKPGNNSVTQRR